MAERIKKTVQDLGTACIGLIKNAGTVQGNPTDNMSKKDLIDSARNTCEKVSGDARLQACKTWLSKCVSSIQTLFI